MITLQSLTLNFLFILKALVRFYFFQLLLKDTADFGIVLILRSNTNRRYVVISCLRAKTAGSK